RMYCPVCENIPLDVCGTDACAQWRDEIKTQLEAGRTPQQIIDDFVARYGDRAIGVPEDPTLRNLSLVTPWLIGIIVLAGAGWVLVKWRQGKPMLASTVINSPSTQLTDDEYRARLERDLQARR